MALAIQLLPEETLKDRKTLTACLTEEDAWSRAARLTNHPADHPQDVVQRIAVAVQVEH
jgi:hypothetical protein